MDVINLDFRMTQRNIHGLWSFHILSIRIAIYSFLGLISWTTRRLAVTS